MSTTIKAAAWESNPRFYHQQRNYRRVRSPFIHGFTPRIGTKENILADDVIRQKITHEL